MAFFLAEPLKMFRFLIEIENNGTKVAAAFTQFSGISMKVETVKVRSGSENRGVMENIPALTSFGNVTLTKGVIGDNEFLDWILAAAPGVSSAPTGQSKYRTINVVALDDSGRRAVTWSLNSAIPVSYELGPMDSSQNSVLTESVEFAIDGFKRETHIPELP